jgi:hypothetical protein
MRKLFSNGLTAFAGVVSMAAPIAQSVPQRTPTHAYRNDPRLACLQHFFGKLNCPAEEFSPIFLSVADANRLDWRLLPSISLVESGGGKTALHNNFFGWDCGRAVFASPVTAIREVAYQLTHSSLYRHKKLEGVLRTYNPDANYARTVLAVMQSIAPTDTLD